MNQEFIVGISWRKGYGIEAGELHLPHDQWIAVDSPFASDAPPRPVGTRCWVLLVADKMAGYLWDVRGVMYRYSLDGVMKRGNLAPLPGQETIAATPLRVVVPVDIEQDPPKPMPAGFETFEALAQAIQNLPTWVEEDSYLAQVDMRARAYTLAREAALNRLGATTRLEIAEKLVGVIDLILLDVEKEHGIKRPGHIDYRGNTKDLIARIQLLKEAEATREEKEADD